MSAYSECDPGCPVTPQTPGHLPACESRMETREQAQSRIRAVRYAQAQAVTMRARGRIEDERAWLDLLALLDEADR